VGHSGGGKSVLLKIIAGLLKPDSGTVRLGSSNVGMLFQKNALFDSFTCEENLLFPLKERKGIVGSEAKERAARFLQAVGLKGNEKLFPDEISGGMQKRLGIARALIVEPEIILYDEPTAGLDPITSRTIADLIRDLRAQGGSTLLTVTNDMQRAYQIGDRVCLLAQGRLVDGGTPAQVQATQDPAIRQFIYGLKQGPLTSGLA
jgi:phospholipid/cholesterol/gamma-HCH transport system ATP-binding protein